MRLNHSPEEADEVRKEGRAAARAGASEHDNPYHRLTMAYRHWRDGFGVAVSPTAYGVRTQPGLSRSPNGRASRCF
jgi:hypothetical protein